MDEDRLRGAMVAAGIRLGVRGLVAAGEGNLSIRLPDDRLLVTPSGQRKDELRPAELLVVPLVRPAAGDLTGERGLRPTSDVAIHRAIYGARPDVGAVVHAHLQAAMALTLAGERPDPMSLPETALFLPILPVVPYAEMGSDELARAIAQALGRGDPLAGAAILERHGAVAVGSAGDGHDGEHALAQALDRIELIDVLCRVTRDALLLRAARRLLGTDGHTG